MFQNSQLLETILTSSIISTIINVAVNIFLLPSINHKFIAKKVILEKRIFAYEICLETVNIVIGINKSKIFDNAENFNIFRQQLKKAHLQSYWLNNSIKLKFENLINFCDDIHKSVILKNDSNLRNGFNKISNQFHINNMEIEINLYKTLQNIGKIDNFKKELTPIINSLTSEMLKRNLKIQQ